LSHKNCMLDIFRSFCVIVSSSITHCFQLFYILFPLLFSYSLYLAKLQLLHHSVSTFFAYSCICFYLYISGTFSFRLHSCVFQLFCVSIFLIACLFVCLPVFRVWLSVCLPVFHVCLFVCLFAFFPCLSDSWLDHLDTFFDSWEQAAPCCKCIFYVLTLRKEWVSEIQPKIWFILQTYILFDRYFP